MIYEYKCPKCSLVYETERKMSKKDEPVYCMNESCYNPSYGVDGAYGSRTECNRLISLPADIFPKADSWRK